MRNHISDDGHKKLKTVLRAIELLTGEELMKVLSMTHFEIIERLWSRLGDKNAHTAEAAFDALEKQLIKFLNSNASE